MMLVALTTQKPMRRRASGAFAFLFGRKSSRRKTNALNTIPRSRGTGE
jgi:hypothetical protein